MNESTIARFAETHRGPVIGRDHPDYETARALHNAMIDKHPLLIARCTDAADVMAAVNFGRDNDLPIAVRGGGHNGSGLGSVDDGLVIDLSLVKGVRVDPAQGTVRVGAGATTGEVDHATSAFGLAVPFGIVSTTGVAGLRLGGGHGYLSRQYGLTVDNLIEADVVLADGRFVTASENENTDLFWALRGGGGNFGVVTSFLFKGRPVDEVLAGPIVFAFEDAAVVMRWYREFVPRAPEDFYVFLGLQTVPPHAPFPEEHWSKRICALVVSHGGTSEEATTALDAIRAELPAPLFDWVHHMPFQMLQSLFDALVPAGLQSYWKGDFVRELTDAAIAVHLEHAADMPAPLSIVHFYPIDGAVQRVTADATAWGHRDVTWSMVISAVDADPAKASELRAWARAYWQAVHPHDRAGGYSNFMMADEGEDRVKAAFGSNYDRLSEIKRKYDPDNLFRANQNIRPAE